MRGLKPSHWAVIGACVVCIVLLSFVSTVPSKRSNAQEEKEEVATVSLDHIFDEEKSSLVADQAGVISSFETSIRNEADVVRKGILYDSLIKYLGSSGKPVMAAWFAREKANANNGSGSDWMAAGERFRSAASFQKEESHVPALYQEAIHCFEKALELEPANLDAKVGLGIAIVDGTSDPMKGISLLREVEAADSNHINVQLALADFAVRSQQFDKAIERYGKVLRLKPEYYGLHLNLAELYQAKGDTANVILHLEAYSSLTDDPGIKLEIENALRGLRK